MSRSSAARSAGELAAVFVGGALGGGGRAALDSLAPHAADAFAVTTLVINTVGSLALGVLVAGVWPRPGVPSWVRVGLGAGVLGSFTTFSAVILSVVTLTTAGETATAAATLGIGVPLGLGAALIGLAIGRGLLARRSGTSASAPGGTP